MARRHQAGAVKQGGSFKGRQFTAEVILWAVRWYLMFPISYRDLELMLADRGVDVDHTTIFRWIQAYAPELEKRIRPHLRPSNGSWRVDETYVKVKGRWTYLYRAVDSRGQTIDFLLSTRRDAEAAKRFFRKALTQPHTVNPRTITVDKNAAYPKATQGHSILITSGSTVCQDAVEVHGVAPQGVGNVVDLVEPQDVEGEAA
jgi:transposase, IS6 family